MTADEMYVIVMGFPGVEVGTSYGHPAYKVGGKFFTRLRDEDASVVLQEVGFDEREMLIEAEPATFHFTDHYRNYPMVLARIESLDAGSLRSFLERRWRKIAPKKLVNNWDGHQS
ncbi:MmcQ/YjbR family DNA-binding protein [Phenylobacterium sp. LjRoot225]|uniref:MmcQ/YjbR family DNA-binding protein n=1 Tax=Phenylobacterium sp. LjRoot225 TaxID=3342285 RepID=UPI003ECF45E3